MPRLSDPDALARFRAALATGCTPTAAARAAGVSQATAHDWLDLHGLRAEYGLPAKVPRPRKPRPDDDPAPGVRVVVAAASITTVDAALVQASRALAIGDLAGAQLLVGQASRTVRLIGATAAAPGSTVDL